MIWFVFGGSAIILFLIIIWSLCRVAAQYDAAIAQLREYESVRDEWE